MNNIPLEFIGERNFLDIELEQIRFENKKVCIIGDMTINSSIDHVLVDGYAELCLSSESGSDTGISIMEKREEEWESSLEQDISSLYLISTDSEGTVVLEGNRSDSVKVRIIVSNVSVNYRYL